MVKGCQFFFVIERYQDFEQFCYDSIEDFVNVKYDLSVVLLIGIVNCWFVLFLGFRIYQYVIKFEIGYNLFIINGNMDL